MSLLTKKMLTITLICFNLLDSLLKRLSSDDDGDVNIENIKEIKI